MFHKIGAYDGFDALEEVTPHYKRTRTRKHFILSKAGIAHNTPACCKCNRPITVETGNRCEHYKGRIICMHYECAWKTVFSMIYK